MADQELKPDGLPMSEDEAYGNMTRAWLNAGPQIADVEAGLRQERRRIYVGIGVVLLIVAVALTVLLLS